MVADQCAALPLGAFSHPCPTMPVTAKSQRRASLFHTLLALLVIQPGDAGKPVQAGYGCRQDLLARVLSGAMANFGWGSNAVVMCACRPGCVNAWAARRLCLQV